MAILIERTEEALVNQKENFDNNIGLVKDKLLLEDADIEKMKNDTLALKYTIGVALILKTSTQSANWFKLHLRIGGEPTGEYPVPPVFPPPPSVWVAGGIATRFSDFIHDKILKSAGYTTDIGKILGILAPEGKEDIALAQPVFKIELTTSGQPLLIWKKGGYQGVEVWKSTDGINFTKLDKDFTPDTIDKSPLPAIGKSEIWYYKMVYLLKDEWVGKWTDVQSIAVMGR